MSADTSHLATSQAVSASTEPAAQHAAAPDAPDGQADDGADRETPRSGATSTRPPDSEQADVPSLVRFGKISYSQNYEDIYIARAFHDIESGFYIDVGAYHPKFDSVTKIFYDTGWSGINIEPGPVFEELQRERVRDVNLRTAITGDGREATYQFHPSAPGTSGLNAAVPSELKAMVDRREAATIATTTLEAVVAEHAPDRPVHFLKLDCEGAEAEIINATDWRALRPELLVVEAVRPNTNDRVDAAWRDTLEAADYAEVFFDGINVYYLRAESMARADAFDRAFNVLDGLEKPDYAAITAIAQLEEERCALNAALTEATAAREALAERLAAAETDRDAMAQAADALADRLSDARTTIDAIEAAAWRDRGLRAALDALRARQCEMEATLRDPAAGPALRRGLAVARALRGLGVR